MSDSKTIAALEIGTGKMQVFIGEIVDGKTLNFIGSGQSMSEGVKKSDICDVRKAAERAKEAIVMAERSTGAKIDSVCLGISGSHIRGFRNIGSANVSGADGIVRAEDIERARKDAESKTLPRGRSYIHKILCGYYLDDKFCTDPLGQKASHIDAEYWMLHGDDDRIADAIHAVQWFGLDVEYLAFSGIASAISATDLWQKEKGVLCIDIGCGSSNYALIKNARILQAGTVPVGGDHLTNDLSFGLRLSPKNSERIKTRFAKAIMSADEKSKKFWTLGDKQIGDRKIPFEAIGDIIRPRLEELFSILRAEVQDYLGENAVEEVVLTGGTSNLNGICAFASGIFELPCSQGKFDSAVRPSLRCQEFSTALGLLEYARLEESKNFSREKRPIWKKISGLFNF